MILNVYLTENVLNNWRFALGDHGFCQGRRHPSTPFNNKLKAKFISKQFIIFKHIESVSKHMI